MGRPDAEMKLPNPEANKFSLSTFNV